MKKTLLLMILILIGMVRIAGADTTPLNLWTASTVPTVSIMNEDKYLLWDLQIGLDWNLGETRPRIHSHDIVDREIKGADIDTRTINGGNLADTIALSDTYLARNRFYPYFNNVQYDSPIMDTTIIYSFMQAGIATQKGSNSTVGTAKSVTFPVAFSETPVFIFMQYAGIYGDSTVRGHTLALYQNEYTIVMVGKSTNTGFEYQPLRAEASAGVFDPNSYYFFNWFAIGRKD